MQTDIQKLVRCNRIHELACFLAYATTNQCAHYLPHYRTSTCGLICNSHGIIFKYCECIKVKDET
jgi:hypothetical protein